MKKSNFAALILGTIGMEMCIRDRYKVTGTINNKKDVLYATNSKSDGAVAFHWT